MRRRRDASSVRVVRRSSVVLSRRSNAHVDPELDGEADVEEETEAIPDIGELERHGARVDRLLGHRHEEVEDDKAGDADDDAGFLVEDARGLLVLPEALGRVLVVQVHRALDLRRDHLLRRGLLLLAAGPHLSLRQRVRLRRLLPVVPRFHRRGVRLRQRHRSRHGAVGSAVPVAGGGSSGAAALGQQVPTPNLQPQTPKFYRRTLEGLMMIMTMMNIRLLLCFLRFSHVRVTLLRSRWSNPI